MEPELYKQFYVGPKGLKYIRLVSLGWVFLLFLVIWFCLRGGVNTVNGKALPKGENELINAVIVSMLFLVAVLIRQTKINRLYKDLSFALNDNMIVQCKNGIQKIGFSYTDITSITRTHRGSLIISSSKGMQLIVPHFIEGRNELETMLSQHFPNITGGPYSFIQKYYEAVIYLTVALFFAIITVNDKMMLLIYCGLIVALAITYMVNIYKAIKPSSSDIKIKLMMLPIGVIFLAMVITAIKLMK